MPAASKSVALVVIDAAAKTYTRYVGKTRTHRCRLAEGMMYPVDVEQFRQHPDSMLPSGDPEYA